MKSLWNDFVTSIRFLTAIPFPQTKESEPRSLATATIFFPLVGLLVASVSLAVAFVLERWFPPNLSNLALVLLPVLLTGGFHMDGFADFCDGFFGGTNKTEVLRIMKDPKIGTWGAAGLVFLIFGKFELLKILPDRPLFFLMAGACSRWAQVALSFFLPYAGEGGGLGETVASKVKPREFIGATLFVLPFLFSVNRCLVVLGFAVALFLLAIFFKRKVGGVTGDLLGAASELSEIFIYLFAVILVKEQVF